VAGAFLGAAAIFTLRIDPSPVALTRGLSRFS